MLMESQVKFPQNTSGASQPNRAAANRKCPARRSTVFLCWLVCEQNKAKNYTTHFHKTWMEDGTRPRIDPINLWCRSIRTFSRDRQVIVRLLCVNNHNSMLIKVTVGPRQRYALYWVSSLLVSFCHILKSSPHHNAATPFLAVMLQNHLQTKLPIRSEWGDIDWVFILKWTVPLTQ